MLRYLTAGESHGELLMGILEGMPSGLLIRITDIDHELARRQGGYGRGGRMKIEKDTVKIYTGVRWGKTLGSPIGLMVRNKDWENWRAKMSADPMFLNSAETVTRPRPGHADLAGVLKYNTPDIRNILERSSARETAMRVAVGAVMRLSGFASSDQPCGEQARPCEGAYSGSFASGRGLGTALRRS
jgi:chorismate synthase